MSVSAKDREERGIGGSGPLTLRAHQEASAIALAIVGEREGVELRCEGRVGRGFHAPCPWRLRGSGKQRYVVRR